MAINCDDCEKYPLCRVKTGIQQVLDLNYVHKQTHQIFSEVARECSYFKEVGK
jgi:hypothetical protein